ncbi:hypothetical protein PJL18_01778 [Paenarthrobacter nicotinovorans]|nr:hypothetical protein [Paenarthrobacter nicotinovorans]
MHLGVRVVHAVAVVLGGDGTQDIAEALDAGTGDARAVALVIMLGDLREEARESGAGGFTSHFVGSAEQRCPHDVGSGVGHLFRTDHQHVPGSSGQHGFDALLEGGGPGSAGVLRPGRGDVGQVRGELERQG